MTNKNGAFLKEIIRIKVNDKEYDVTVLEVVFDVMTETMRYYCMYTYLEDSADMEDEQLNYPTFRHKNTIGVDTAHSFNQSQTMTQKYSNALEQIKNCIKDYQKIYEMRKTDLKYQVKKRVEK